MATVLFCTGVSMLMILHSAATAFDPNVCVGKPKQLIYADPTDLRGFYSCEGGHAIHHSCQQGEVFEPKVGNCVVPLPAPSPGFCTLKPDGIYKDPTNKVGFYKCVSGAPFYRICQRPLLFNSSTAACESEASPQLHTITMPPLKLWRISQVRRSLTTTARKETRAGTY